MGTGAQWTGADWFVVEADESDGTHLELPLYGTILTNVEVDHLDHYGSFDGIVASFDQYLAHIAGPKVLCADDDVCARLATKCGGITYGLTEAAHYRAVQLRPDNGSFRFVVEYLGQALGEVHLPLRGKHNVQNATGVIAMAMSIGVSFEVAARALGRFGGVARRFDLRGQHRGATLVDDYAHLPSEIAAVLGAARSSGDGWRLVFMSCKAHVRQRRREEEPTRTTSLKSTLKVSWHVIRTRISSSFSCERNGRRSRLFYPVTSLGWAKKSSP
jgi:UDP-N-acetylmuramate--alanine ligase